MKYVNEIWIATRDVGERHQVLFSSAGSNASVPLVSGPRGPALSPGPAESSSSPASPARCNCRAARRRFAIWYVMTTDRIRMPCRMMMNSRGTSLWICSATSPRDRIPHRIAAKTMPIGLFCPRNATAIPVNPSAHDVVLRQVPAVGEDLLHPDQPGQGARDQEQLAAASRRSRRRPPSPSRGTNRRLAPRSRAASAGSGTRRRSPAPIARKSSHDRCAPGVMSKYCPMSPTSPCSGNSFVRRSTNAPSGRVVEVEREVDRPGDEADGDPVHHDRRDDLVRAGLHLQDAGDRRPDHPAEHRRQQRERHQDRAGQRA